MSLKDDSKIATVSVAQNVSVIVRKSNHTLLLRPYLMLIITSRRGS